MKHRLYKPIITFIAIGFLGTSFAQKFDKKFTENFKTNKDVEVAINASNTDINVTIWNKNEVQVEAFIEIEGISKEEAEKYFKDWQFEALGNSKKVKITSKGSNAFNFKNDFVFFDNMNFDFEMPEINLPEFETIVIPDMDFDFDFDLDLDFDNIFDDLDKNMGKDGKYEFRWKDDDHNIEINSKEEWEAFKKTKEYEKLKKKLTLDKEKMRKELAESKAKMRVELKKVKEEFQKVDKEEIRQQLEKAKKELKKMNFHFNSEDEDVIINGKKINIKKRLEIKVPKDATFNLNTRHCKVKLPNTVACGNVKYGSFFANNLKGGELTIDYSQVIINGLFSSDLSLNNVVDAKIAFIQNSILNNNSSNVEIQVIDRNTDISDKFGELLINELDLNFGELILNTSHSNVIINLNKVKTSLAYDLIKSRLDDMSNNFNKLIFSSDTFITKSGIINSMQKNSLEVNSEYSTILIK
ncbi:hypothetical protein BW723_16145 [Polaribacter reichenbachii]|uniref:Adhesin domain-containing protein n=1 Tax=Polaribacter reichenbachii TaxID=996801 RepID=A0A1B8U2D5_9FLAO|nr:hypothetical protein [Polaribacter reichenbachii]APZ47731.1 hypothetical protein BW723_16145 [Polaribacter reichenbachii]AUC18365.1 hypothetical protein BTO17_06560 [Polaribacter reichenbachii]OBY66026.1 hypothetical protein LPB301_07310 [Polaribacter reichenbachii]